MSKFSINFLGANIPLTKVFRANGEKEAYPLVKNFTSYTKRIGSITELHDAIVEHSKEGHCLLKGELTRTLNNEPRVNSTRTDDPTWYICLDFDKHETPDIDLTLQAMGLGDISYVIQYSSSHGLPENEGTVSAHVFMLLDQPVLAPMIKAWLMSINLDKWPGQLTLSPTGTHMSWSLDITTCQNDKLLYIAPPIFEKPLKDPLRNRIKLVKRERERVVASNVFAEQQPAKLKAKAKAQLNKLRKEAGLPTRTGKGVKWEGSYEVDTQPDVCSVSEVKDCGDYIRLNLNGGDSFAYWHPKENFKLIHDFKSGSTFYTKDLVPGYYAQKVAEQEQALGSVSENGDLVLGFCDLATAEYYRGLWNPDTQKLSLHRCKDMSQVNHWYMSHGLTPPAFIPTWNIMYDPNADWVMDEEEKCINTFRKSEYMKLEADPRITTNHFPNIYRMIRHFLGEDENGPDTTVSDHFLNWFAVIMQRKAKPRTAWVNHGVQGTGKGFFMSKVVTPLLGKDNVAEVGIANIEDQFNGWLEGKLFVNVNEIDVDDFSEKGRVEAKFKMLITDNVMPVRRMRQTMSQEPNYASFLFSSNKRKPVMVPADDRRHNVGNRQTIKLVPPKEEDVESELEAFAKWLLAHKADVAAANAIIQTEARATMQKLGSTSIEETTQVILEGDFDSLWMNMQSDEVLDRGGSYSDESRIYNMVMKDIGKRILEEGVRQNVSRDEMGIILRYNVSKAIPNEPNKLTSLLRQHGIETKQLRHKGRKTYGIVTVWKMSSEIRKEVEASVGARPKLRRAK